MSTLREQYLSSLSGLSDTDRQDEIFELWKQLGHLFMDHEKIDPGPEWGMCSACFRCGEAYMVCPICRGQFRENAVCPPCHDSNKPCKECQGLSLTSTK